MAITDLTPGDITAGLLAPGAHLTSGQFTYSIANAASTWGNYLAGTQPFSSYSSLSAAQATAFRMAIGAWDALIAPNFAELTDTATQSGEIRVAFTSYQMDSDTAAYTFLPVQHVLGSKDGDVWVNSSETGSDFSVGTDLYVAFLHEIGHALGLKHSFETPVIPAAYDSTRYTVMSYTSAAPDFAIGFKATSGGGITTDSQRVVAATPMVLDIFAVQSLYGADTTTAAGANSYTFSESDTTLKTIYDAGGVDTFDMSNFHHQVMIDLTPGAYSSIGFWSVADQIAYWQGIYPQYSSFIDQVLTANTPYTWQDNVGIAFGTVIENAIGGSADDWISGNDADNVLSGGAGADTLIGGLGADTLDGGTGVDKLYGGGGSDVYVVDSQSDLVFEEAGGGVDTVVSTANFYLYANIENLTLASGAGDIFGVGNELANTITGNEGANTLLAGAGADTVHGGAGVDILYGQDGNDQLFGDAGNDFLAGGSGDDVMDGGTGGDSLYGEDGNDTLTGGSDFVFDQLVGGNGDDVLHGDSGLGDYDYLYGNAGNDTFYVDTPADLVFEQAGEGTDTVYANINGGGYYLYDNIENLILLGNTPFGVGNALDNHLTGNAIGNYLLGGAGNDVLNGKAGNDVLFGEAGADTFVFEHGTGADVIGDFAPGTDKIDLSAIAGFTSFAQVQAHMVENGGNSAIDLGNGSLVVINGVTNAQFHQSDFILFGASAATESAIEPRLVAPTMPLHVDHDMGFIHGIPSASLPAYAAALY